MRGRAPLWRQLASRLLVPRAPAATITPRAVCVRRRLRSQEPERSLVDRVAVGAVGGAERADLGHLALGLDLDPELLGEPEVVLHQRVLGAVAAADHAAAAAHAAGAAGPLAAEEGVGDLDPRLVEEDPDLGVGEGLADADLLAVFLQQLVGRADAFVLDHAEHPLCRVVVGRELPLPVAQLVPLRVFEEGRAGPVERVGVAEAAAADAAAGDDEDVLEEGHPHHPAEAEARHPEVAARVPQVRLGEVLVAEAAAALQHRDLVALFGEPQGGDAAAEAGPNYQPVVVVSHAAAFLGRLRPRRARAAGSPRSWRRRRGRTSLWGCPRTWFRAGCRRRGRRSPGRR